MKNLTKTIKISFEGDTPSLLVWRSVADKNTKNKISLLKSNVIAVEVEYFEFEVEYIKIEVENRKFEVEYIKIEVENMKFEVENMNRSQKHESRSREEMRKLKSKGNGSSKQI